MTTQSGPIRLTWPERTVLTEALKAGRLSPTGEPKRDAPVTLIAGDNLLGIAALTESLRDEVGLIYMDPPFLTGRRHMSVAKARGSEKVAQKPEKRVAFDDRWGGLVEYMTALGRRIEAARDLLRDDGSLVVHVDSKTSHYVKVLCDEIFGLESFASEIIWRYRRWPSRTANFQRVHDTLLRYVKDPSVAPRFNQLYEPLAASTVATWGKKKQRAVLDERTGRRARSSKTQEETPGTPMGDVWEIGIIAPVAKERTGYPTQKPMALMERIVESCSCRGDLVLDPYAGSGTTLEAAAKLGRRAIGIDMGKVALETARARLAASGIEHQEFRVLEVTEKKATARGTRRTRAPKGRKGATYSENRT